MKSAGALAAVSTTGFSKALAEDDVARVDEKGPMAKALNYVHDAKTVDTARRASDRFCYNCALFAGSQDDEWAECSIFPGKNVAGKGWCSAWAPKPDNS
jgi:hypothetical protein